MARQPEALLIDRIRKAIYVEWPQAWTFKVAGGGYQSAGVPDLLVVLNGHLIALEAKCPRPGETDSHARNRVTERQAVEMDRLTSAGATCAVVLTPEEAVAAIRGVI